jgi:hypothetical protein
MGTNHRKLKNNLKDPEEDKLSDYLSKRESGSMSEKEENRLSKILLFAVVLFLGVYFFNDIRSSSFNPISSVVSSVVPSGPSEDLLNRMNTVMEQMGYMGLSHDDLRDLRSEGVTATYISNIRSLGFTDLTLEQSVQLANANVSSTFIAMMMELGYNLGLEDFMELRRAGVTAHFTSNIHDLGYTDVTTDQLVRMVRIGVTPSLVERLQEERGSDISLEEIIRYRISNQ